MVCGQHFVVYPGLVIKTVKEAFGHNFNQVLVPLAVFCQQYQVVIAVFAAAHFPVKPGTGRHVDFAADNRLDARFPGRAVKINDAVHNAMVCYRHAVHAQFLGTGNQFFDFARSVQQAVFRVDM